MSTLYETDFYSWTEAQARRLRHAASFGLNEVPTGLALATVPIFWPFSAEQAMDETFFREGAA